MIFFLHYFSFLLVLSLFLAMSLVVKWSAYIWSPSVASVAEFGKKYSWRFSTWNLLLYLKMFLCWLCRCMVQLFSFAGYLGGQSVKSLKLSFQSIIFTEVKARINLFFFSILNTSFDFILLIYISVWIVVFSLCEWALSPCGFIFNFA